MNDAASTRKTGKSAPHTQILACGALAREILALIEAGGLQGVELACLPAKLHNQPQFIPERVREAIRAAKARGVERVLVAYADCGTGGRLDRVLEEEDAARIQGPHCYAFYSGQTNFAEMMEAEPASFFLTDYLARHFETLILKGMGIDKHPELEELMFGNYRRLVYLAQEDTPELRAKAEAAAARLGLEYEHRKTGYGELAGFVAAAAQR
jgi:hypothetical protein